MTLWRYVLDGFFRVHHLLSLCRLRTTTSYADAARSWRLADLGDWHLPLQPLKIELQKERIAMERVEIIRDCEAIQIPAGTPVTLEKGIEVFITQSLGGTYTLQVPAYGGLFRVSGKDADALGKSPEQSSATAIAQGDLETMVWDQLKTCFDPEIPVNIVDLGLVYGMELTPVSSGAHKVDVK